MGLLDLLTKRETRAEAGNPANDGWTPATTNKPHAEKLAIVQACVDLIAGSIASLPAGVKVGDEPVTDHPLNRLIVEGVNESQSWHAFVEFLVAEILLQGNGAARIMTDSQGQIVGLVPVPWALANLAQTPSGRIVLDYTEETLAGGMAASHRLLAGEYIHVKNRGRSRFYGESQLQRAAASIDMATSTEEFANTNWRNMAQPSGVLSHDKLLSKDAARRLKENWVTRFGGANRGMPAVLEEGLTYTPLPLVSPVDAELLESRKFSVLEICRAFGVPGVLVNVLEQSSYNNIESLTRQFATLALSAHVSRIEQEMARALFTADERAKGYRLDLDMSGLLRADPAQRWAGHKIALDSRVLTPEEVRKIEGFGPIEGKTNANDSTEPLVE